MVKTLRETLLLVLLTCWTHTAVLQVSAFLPIFRTITPVRMTTSLGSTSNEQQSKEATANSEDVPLIPREVLFGNPKFAAPKVSPDGKFLAYLGPSEDLGVLNVFVRDTYDPSTARMVTADTSRGIRTFSFAEDSKTILYLQDFEGECQFVVVSFYFLLSGGESPVAQSFFLSVAASFPLSHGFGCIV